MKSLFYTKTLIALAVAVAATTSGVNRAQGQPAPPASAEAALPAGIVPGSPLADVVKMLQAGVDANTIRGYILNCQNPFNLDADKIVSLKDMGATSDLINAMMDRDKALYAASVTPPPAPAPVAVPAPAMAPPPDASVAPAPPEASMAPPPTEITVNYFNDALTPYGSWVDVEGYGRCWRPTAVIYNAAWSPYCDSGHWVYTDYGWYWDSDYSWGVTFHYGRWFRNPRFGWCWYPDTVWAPSWVAWRSGGEYCGWAPLPPFAVFRPGAGFFYRGVSVGVDFDFGLGADCFVFMSPDHFCDRRLRSYCVPRERIVEVYHQTTIINHYDVNNRTIVNRGFGVERITSVTHHPIEAVHVSALANAGRQGWRGEGFERTLHPTPLTRDVRGNDNPVRTGINPNLNAGHNFNAVNTGSGHEVTPNNGTQLRRPADTLKAGEVSTRHDTSGQNVQGLQQNGHPTENFRLPVQNVQPVTGQGQSPNNVHQPLLQQSQVRNVTESKEGTAQFKLPQNPNAGTAANQGLQQHGAGQLQQNGAPITGQAQVRAVGNGANNGQNNNNNKKDPNKPNQ